VHNGVEGGASKDKEGVAATALVQPSEKRTDSRIGVHMSPDTPAWRDGSCLLGRWQIRFHYHWVPLAHGRRGTTMCVRVKGVARDMRLLRPSGGRNMSTRV
jgi:hypothetical protein